MKGEKADNDLRQLGNENRGAGRSRAMVDVPLNVRSRRWVTTVISLIFVIFGAIHLIGLLAILQSREE